MRSVSMVGCRGAVRWISGIFFLAMVASLCPYGQAQEPIRIGVIGEESAVAGASLTKAASLAADEINAQGGVNGRRIQVITYDNHSSAAEGVHAFQRAVSQDKVVAVIGSYLSEVALAIEPWAARMRVPFITPGASSNAIPQKVHDDYEHNKYTFQGLVASEYVAQSVCDFSHDVLVKQLHFKNAVVMSEDAAWTTPLDARYLDCLPKAGLAVLDHIRFNPDTTDFTPIFNQIERKHPDVIITGISHVGVQPTVQWHDQQVPIPMAGQSSQATNGTFWKDTNGAAEGVITRSTGGPGVALTPRTIAFTNAYTKRYGLPPAYCGYSSYDMVYVIADAIKRAGSTDPDKLVDALEKTDYVGTSGRLQFYGRGDPFTHSVKYGPGLAPGAIFQWQNGKQVAIWPADKANAKIQFPSFIKLSVK
jgi:branched-chain amino acid transport system substrate-binding protein